MRSYPTVRAAGVWLAVGLILAGVACGGDDAPWDARHYDAATGPDSNVPDAAPSDAIAADAAVADATLLDAQQTDAEVADAEVADAEVSDAEVSDAEVPDAEVPDAEVPDAEVSDAEVPDAEVPDAEVPDAAAPADASIGDIFDHFTFELTPASPIAGRDFALTIIAYSSVDDSAPMTGYDGTISVIASAGTLTGETTGQPIVGGTATLTLQDDTPGTGVVLTVTDDVFPAITGQTAPFDIVPPGTEANALDVVINEVNWFGNSALDDEWIEIRNVSGGAVVLTEWTIENAGTSSFPIVTFDAGTTLDPGETLLVANLLGADSPGTRTSLTDVAADVQLHLLDLDDAGEQLILADPDGTVIDSTPTGAWPAGSDTALYSMERRDDVTGGGYTDGTQPGAWYTWSSLDGLDTTNPDSADFGTPGANNTDPDIFDHFTFQITPATPAVDADFDLTATAYSSADDSVVIATYHETISVTASAPTLSGQTTNQPVASGTATLTLQHDTATTGLTLTVTDDIYPDITGTTAPFDIQDGSTAGPLDVVINEVNWFGNADTGDEWIELRNISGRSLNLNGWSIDSAGSGGSSATINVPAVVPDGGYFVVGDRQGADEVGARTSLTGVSDVFLHNLSLANNGEELILRDATGTAIDSTPTGAWPAGDNDVDRTMERRDEITGGGYTDGALAGSWYTWNPADGNRDYTNPYTNDQGTPGADNSDPNATFGTMALPYSTSLEPFEPPFVKVAGALDALLWTTPPDDLLARTGAKVVNLTNMTLSYADRDIRTAHCIALDNDTDDVSVTSFAAASTGNGANTVTARIALLWFDDDACTNSAGADSLGGEVELPQGTYASVDATAAPPSGATHFQIRFEVQRSSGSDDDHDNFAADDFYATQ